MSQRDFIGIWRKWYAKQTGEEDETRIKVSGRHAKAAKEMRQYFTDVYPNRTPEECLEAILKNWNRLPEWYRPKWMELFTINDQLNNIITFIKNGKPTSAHEQALDRLRKGP